MKRLFRLERRTRGGSSFLFIYHDEDTDTNLVSFFCEQVRTRYETLYESNKLTSKPEPTIRVVEWDEAKDKKKSKGIQFTTKWR